MSVFSNRFKKETSSRFKGTKEDFNKYLGGFCRNLVQKITKPYKASIGKCENCGATNRQLDAAHVHGKERKEIISMILNDYKENGRLNVNLEEFEAKFIAHHQPIEDVIKILCKDCHRQYDGPTNTINQSSDNMQNNYYQSSRLLFKKNIIEPLQMTEKFSIHVTSSNETFTMSKTEFYQTFYNVVDSDSYSKGGSYSYSKIPDKAYQYLAPTKSTALSQMKPVIQEESVTSKQIKIGRLIKEFFKENGRSLNPTVIQNLQSKEYSKRELGCNFPVLIPNTNSKYIKGYNRYYKDEYVPGYWLCSQWYEWDKEKFLKWKTNI
jgi:hypothetical protein